MRQLLLWFYMMSKRLYRKPVFLVILALIPVLVLGYSTLSTDDSGVVTIALAQEGQDELASKIIGDFQKEESLIRYVLCDTPRKAEDLVKAGKADAAWIFPAQMEARIKAYVEDPSSSNAFITVLEREDSVALMLTREKLCGMLFSYCAKTLYISYIRENIPGLAELSDAELMEYYENTGLSEDIFAFTDSSGGENMLSTKTHYLMTPLRGLLAVVIVLCGLATAMFYMQDSQKGVFAWVSESRRGLVEAGYQLVSVLHISLAALLSLVLSGMNAPVWREVPALLLFCLCTVAFCMVLRQLCGSVGLLGTLIPLILVAMLLICPVFIDLGFLRQAQLLFPPTYYINAVYNRDYLWYMALYIPCAGVLYWLLGFLPGRKEKR